MVYKYQGKGYGEMMNDNAEMPNHSGNGSPIYAKKDGRIRFTVKRKKIEG